MGGATPVSALPPDLAAEIGTSNLIVFDGVCVFCSGFFRFMLRRDRDKAFHFATAQSPLGQALYAALGLPLTEFETNLIITNGQIYQRLDAFAAAMAELRLPWRVLALCRYLPGGVKDAIYKPIARNRYRLFGKTETCLLPDAQTRQRFLPGGL